MSTQRTDVKHANMKEYEEICGKYEEIWGKYEKNIQEYEYC